MRLQAAAALAPSGNVPSIMRQAASVRQIVMHMLTVAALRVQGALAHNSRQFALDGPRGFRYTFTVRPSGGMADAAVSKTVVLDVRVQIPPRAPPKTNGPVPTGPFCMLESKTYSVG